MGLPQRKALLTPGEYLAIERKAEHRSEYFRGEMFAMAGGTVRAQPHQNESRPNPE